jgi:hypothetical protein
MQDKQAHGLYQQLKQQFDEGLPNRLPEVNHRMKTLFDHIETMLSEYEEKRSDNFLSFRDELGNILNHYCDGPLREQTEKIEAFKQ